LRRLGILAAAGALLGLLAAALTAAPALAGRGHKWQYVPAKPMTVPAVYCGFKIRLTFPADKEYGKLLKAADGSMISLFTGSFKVSFTNLSTGKTITENASSPLKQTSTSRYLILSNGGHVGLLLTPADSKRFGLPTVSVTAGRLTAKIATASGAIASLSLHGHVQVNVCAALN